MPATQPDWASRREGASDGDLDERHGPRAAGDGFPGGGGRPRAGPLRPGGRGGVDRPHEVHGRRGRGIRPFVANSPLLSWVYGPLSVRGFSTLLGVVEVAIALLIAARSLSPRASALG